MCGILEIGVVFRRTFVSTLFATLFRNHKNYTYSIVLWVYKHRQVCCDNKILSIADKSYHYKQEIAFQPVRESSSHRENKMIPPLNMRDLIYLRSAPSSCNDIIATFYWAASRPYTYFSMESRIPNIENIRHCDK